MADNTTGGYTAAERLYLDKHGNVVKGDDPERVELLVGVGGTVPRARAIALGLIEVPETAAAQQTDDETFSSLQPPLAGADKAAAAQAADKAAAASVTSPPASGEAKTDV